MTEILQTYTMDELMNELDVQLADLKTVLQSDDVGQNPIFNRPLSVNATPFVPDTETLTPVPPSIDTVNVPLHPESEEDIDDKYPVETVLTEDLPVHAVSITDPEVMSFLFLITLLAVALRLVNVSPEFIHVRNALANLLHETKDVRFQLSNILKTTAHNMSPLMPLLRPRIETISRSVLQSIGVYSR
jgi:hypothetical protein